MGTNTFRSLGLMAALTLVASAPVGVTSVVDWDNPAITWFTGAPALIDLNGDTVNDLRLDVTGSVEPGAPLKITAPYTGGFSGHRAVQLWTQSGVPGGMDVTVTFLPGGLYDTGVLNLSYALFDVDGDGGTEGTDLVSGSQATLVAGGTTTPLSMVGSAANTITLPDSATGVATAADDTAQGTVTTTYGNSAIRSFVFHYDNPLSNNNGIALGDLNFDFPPVPEAGTVAACAVASLVGAWGLRRMRRGQPVAA